MTWKDFLIVWAVVVLTLAGTGGLMVLMSR
jgi:hypothetical protein